MPNDLTVLRILYCACFFVIGSISFGQITTGGTLTGFSRITPTDSAGHLAGTTYSVSLAGQSAGSMN